MVRPTLARLISGVRCLVMGAVLLSRYGSSNTCTVGFRCPVIGGGGGGGGGVPWGRGGQLVEVGGEASVNAD